MIELVLRAPQELVEPLSDRLVDELDALSVSVADADADTADERPLFGEPGLAPPAPAWKRSTLRALFDDEAGADRAAAWLVARHGAEGLALVALEPLADDDWVRRTQAQFAPVEITPDFWVVPSWHEPPASARRVIRLDPGLAFGTGTHPTTRMCLRWIAAEEAAGRGGWPRVLDYGCGSGILALGAALHGATDIDAVDIDPAAVAAAQANAAHHGLRLRVGLPELAFGAYDLVLANILARPLELLAPLLAAHTGPGGALVLAGLLDAQVATLQAAYAPWLTLQVADRDEGWVLLAGRRAV
jgi:ribosomal protein L11 methyltransferase